jgi:hypothetical protein
MMEKIHESTKEEARQRWLLEALADKESQRDFCFTERGRCKNPVTALHYERQFNKLSWEIQRLKKRLASIKLPGPVTTQNIDAILDEIYDYTEKEIEPTGYQEYDITLYMEKKYRPRVIDALNSILNGDE